MSTLPRNPIHPLARLNVSERNLDGTPAAGGRRPWTLRTNLLALARAKGSCHVCGGKGSVPMPGSWSAPRKAYDRETKEWSDIPSPLIRFVAPVPCFNPACTAPKPANACTSCDGLGQKVRDGELTDIACGACHGFGHTGAGSLSWLDEALGELAAVAS